MELNGISQAKILSEALPYIQNYAGKTVVIKYGGNAMIEDGLKNAVIRDIVLLSLVGINVVVVHGGGPEINDMLKKIGKETKFVNGLRYTDNETMDIVQMVLCGKVNKDLVYMINNSGGKAIGICGMDAKLIEAKKIKDETDYGLVGDIINVNCQVINDILEKGYIPVVSTVGYGCDENKVYNINADTAAAQLAIALHAEKLILLTDVRGLLLDMSDENSLIREVKVSEVPRLFKDGIVKGGMIPKVECCFEAVRSGVKQANIQDGRVPHSILIEMLSNEGVGTVII